MRKLLYFATALLVLVGCNKDNALNNAPEGTPFKKGQQVTLTVGTGNNANQVAPRRVAGKDNGTQIDFTWEAGDQILVKVGDESAVFTLSSTPGSAEGEFTGTMLADGSTFDIQYPTETPDLSAQEYTEAKPIPANKMFFKATSCTLGTNNVLYAQYAMVQLNLYGTERTISKIVFTNITASPAESYTLTCTDGVTIGATSTAATPFYMVVSAGEYQFEVAVYDNATTPAKICSFATSEAKTFEAGKCLNMPAKEVAIFVPTYVDLGLSVKWATCNVGATKPEEYGDYFAWGETTTKSAYNESTYFDTNDGGSTFIKYNLSGGKTVLELADDAAYKNWGGAWRMPTKDEQDELRNTNNCTWEPKTNYNGTNVNGYLVTSKKNGNSIFLPASGYRHNASLYDVGYGHYWSSSLYVNNSNDAYGLYFTSSNVNWYNLSRDRGRSVRPVCQ